LKKELQRVARNNWRQFIDESTKNPAIKGKGLWRLARWSRQRAGKPKEEPHLPDLRQTDQHPYQTKDEDKARILATRFFPRASTADLSDIPPHILGQLQELTKNQPIRDAPIGQLQELTKNQPIRDAPNQSINNATTSENPLQISEANLQAYIAALPNNKAPGPKGIPNEVLKLLGPDIAKKLLPGINQILATGQIPQGLRQSTTKILKKEGKKDYSLPESYRPIALENVLAKLCEKIAADQLTQLAEQQDLLSWNQIGARKGKSTLSAISLISSYVQTAWQTKAKSIVSMLSLDIASAFDRVPHERLLFVLLQKGLPQWLIRFIASFLTGRQTRISFPGHESDWIQTPIGIPQGSPLSPILFLFYISELLESLQAPENDTFGFGFVDDTNLITWGRTAAENCQRLTTAHDKCIAWAKRYGATFAPRKYNLIHFTRQRRHSTEDLASTIQINGQGIEVCSSLKVLGIWIDSQLTWKT
jgi:hypothetical protein